MLCSSQWDDVFIDSINASYRFDVYCTADNFIYKNLVTPKYLKKSTEWLTKLLLTIFSCHEKLISLRHNSSWFAQEGNKSWRITFVGLIYATSTKLFDIACWIYDMVLFMS